MEHEDGAFKVNRVVRFAAVNKAPSKGLSLRTNRRVRSTLRCKKNRCRKFSQTVIFDHELDRLPIAHTFFLPKIYANLIALSCVTGGFFNEAIKLRLVPTVAWFLRLC
jgi:hypothetical protein